MSRTFRTVGDEPADQYLGHIAPILSSVYPLDDIGGAARLMRSTEHTGKDRVLCLIEVARCG